MKIVTAGLGAACIAALLAHPASAGATRGADARPAAPPAAAKEEPAAKASQASQDDRSGCRTVRRRMWLEREGWVVRKITICY